MFAEMVAPKDCENPGHVYAIEIKSDLVKFAQENIERTGYSDRVTIIDGVGGVGLPDCAPFDIVSVAAASKRIPPPLLDQVAVGGRLVLPVGRSFYRAAPLESAQEAIPSR